MTTLEGAVPTPPTYQHTPSAAVVAFDRWIRTRFVELNTELEELYFAQDDPSAVEGVGEELKAELVAQGRQLIVPVLAEGDTDEGFERAFAVLGNVGFYMAACRRHEVTNPARERSSPLSEASALALHLGAALGTAPRFVTSHLETHNEAIDGVYKTFTSLEAERVFLDDNTRSAFAYMRAADALTRVIPIGVSHPVALDLLLEAERGLIDALRINEGLAERLDADRFFSCVRPYYRPYRVGPREFRGANAGDFAAFNEVDLLLGLCRADDASYSQLVVDKYPYLLPAEQARLREVFRHPSILDTLLEHQSSADEPWFQAHAAAFLRVCEAHGRVAAHHHDVLVADFIVRPSESLPAERLEGLTASGPPLEVLLGSLERLRDQRLAVDRPDVRTRFDDLRHLRALVV